MPLAAGSDRATVSRNIREMVRAGHPQQQAIAAALHNARRYATGGTPAAPQTPTYATPPAQSFSSSGLIPGVGSGDYQLTPNTGAVKPSSLTNIRGLAERGLNVPGGPAQGAPAAGAAGAGGAAPAVWNGDTAAQASVDPAIFEAPFNNGSGGNKRGGRLAMGGPAPVSSAEMASWTTRREASDMDHPSGLVASATPGRRDVIPLSVASGSYVVPADVVSGISEGNTLAGARHLEAAMSTGPGGLPLSHMVTHSTMPHPPSVAHLAHGGMADGQMPRMVHPREWANRDVPNGIPVIVAGGEYILSPDQVRHIGDGDLTRGHDKLDQLVLHARARNVRATAKLPGPKKGNER